MPHVLIMRPIHDDAIALLEAAPGVTVEVVHKLTKEAMDAALPRANGIIVRTNVVDGARMFAFPAGANGDMCNLRFEGVLINGLTLMERM